MIAQPKNGSSLMIKESESNFKQSEIYLQENTHYLDVVPKSSSGLSLEASGGWNSIKTIRPFCTGYFMNK